MIKPRSMKTILVVDDDPAILAVFDMLFDDNRYSVQLAADGKTALEIIGCRCPDLIILDLMMPVVNGWDIIRALRSAPDTCRVPILIISAHKNVEQVARELKVDDYSAKPFDVDDVMEKAERLLSA